MTLTDIELDIKIDGKKVKSVVMPEFEQGLAYKENVVSYLSGTVSGLNYHIHLSGDKKKERKE
jgi:hypothetical protein